ncbi:hypothetical protein FPV67DRAFT_1460823 [Lyophyllum atratum]|nr:hypothetical protein FPV67DRAFT_1460823 [Lyophyllum atratum]
MAKHRLALVLSRSKLRVPLLPLHQPGCTLFVSKANRDGDGQRGRAQGRRRRYTARCNLNVENNNWYCVTKTLRGSLPPSMLKTHDWGGPHRSFDGQPYVTSTVIKMGIGCSSEIARNVHIYRLVGTTGPGPKSDGARYYWVAIAAAKNPLLLRADVGPSIGRGSMWTLRRPGGGSNCTEHCHMVVENFTEILIYAIFFVIRFVRSVEGWQERSLSLSLSCEYPFTSILPIAQQTPVIQNVCFTVPACLRSSAYHSFIARSPLQMAYHTLSPASSPAARQCGSSYVFIELNVDRVSLTAVRLTLDSIRLDYRRHPRRHSQRMHRFPSLLFHRGNSPLIVGLSAGVAPQHFTAASALFTKYPLFDGDLPTPSHWSVACALFQSAVPSSLHSPRLPSPGVYAVYRSQKQGLYRGRRGGASDRALSSHPVGTDTGNRYLTQSEVEHERRWDAQRRKAGTSGFVTGNHGEDQVPASDRIGVVYHLCGKDGTSLMVGASILRFLHLESSWDPSLSTAYPDNLRSSSVSSQFPIDQLGKCQYSRPKGSEYSSTMKAQVHRITQNYRPFDRRRTSIPPPAASDRRRASVPPPAVPDRRRDVSFHPSQKPPKAMSLPELFELRELLFPLQTELLHSHGDVEQRVAQVDGGEDGRMLCVVANADKRKENQRTCPGDGQLFGISMVAREHFLGEPNTASMMAECNSTADHMVTGYLGRKQVPAGQIAVGVPIAAGTGVEDVVRRDGVPGQTGRAHRLFTWQDALGELTEADEQ